MTLLTKKNDITRKENGIPSKVKERSRAFVASKRAEEGTRLRQTGKIFTEDKASRRD